MRVTLPVFFLVLVDVMPVLAAEPLELPTRKTGLWEILRQGKSVPRQTTQECVDAATDAIMMSIGVLFVHFLGECPKLDVQRSGDAVTIDSACSFSGPLGDTTLAFHTVITGNFDAAYTITATGTRREPDPIPEGPKPTLEETGKWLGSCAADQKPGDIIGPGPLRQNALEIQRDQQEAERRRPRQQGVPPPPRIPPWIFRSMWPRG